MPSHCINSAAQVSESVQEPDQEVRMDCAYQSEPLGASLGDNRACLPCLGMEHRE